MNQDITQLEDAIAKFIKDLETEDRLNRVGLKDKAESEKVYKKYRDLIRAKNLDEIKKKIQSLKASKPQGYQSSTRRHIDSLTQIDILERIYFTLASSYIGLNLSKKQDQISTYFSSAKVKVNGEEIPYFQLSPLISKEPIFEKRERYDDAASKVVIKTNRKQLTLILEEIKILKDLGFKSYLDFYSSEKKIDFSKFATVVNRLKADTDKLWTSVISQVSNDVLRRPFKNILSCHLSYLRSMSIYDRYYPAEKVVSTFEKFAGDLELSDLLKSVKIDDVNRPKKNPRAVCYWPSPPSEIHLVIKPIGGEQDYEAMFHEGGHALHGAAIDDRLPYSLKALAHSNALTECYAFILEDLVFDSVWLKQNVNISDFTAGKIQWQASFVNLMMLRRYFGKFLYEYEMFAGSAIQNYSSSGAKRGREVSSQNTINLKVSSLRQLADRTISEGLSLGPSLYKKNLEATTGFVHKKENWLNDMDSGFYSSNYLRAWIGAAQIKDYLLKKYGRKWFTNKKAGKFLRDLWSRGVTDELEDVIKRLGYKPWDVKLLVRGYKEVLR